MGTSDRNYARKALCEGKKFVPSFLNTILAVFQLVIQVANGKQNVAIFGGTTLIGLNKYTLSDVVINRNKSKFTTLRETNTRGLKSFKGEVSCYFGPL